MVVEAGEVLGGQGEAARAFLGGEVAERREVAGSAAQRPAYAGEHGRGQSGVGVVAVPDAARWHGFVLVVGGQVQDGLGGRGLLAGLGFLDAQREAGSGTGVGGVLDRVGPGPQFVRGLGLGGWGAGERARAQERGCAGGADHRVRDGVEEGPEGVLGCDDAQGRVAGEETVTLGGHSGGGLGDGGAQRVGDRADAPAAVAVGGQGGVDALLGHARHGQAESGAPSGDGGVLAFSGGEEGGQGEVDGDGDPRHGGAARHDAAGAGENEFAGDRLQWWRQVDGSGQGCAVGLEQHPCGPGGVA